MGTMAERFQSVGRSAASGSTATDGMSGMLDVEFNMDAVKQHVRDLGKMLTGRDDPMYIKLRAIVRKEIKAARGRVAKDVRASMSNDPRAAYRAVRHTIYKSVLGGTLNILAPRRAGAPVPFNKVRKLDANPHQRGGNRTPIDENGRTKKLNEYFGKDRGFILRFLNSGTEIREIRRSPHHRLGGNRGSIRARNMFSTSAVFQTAAAIEAINEAFEQEFEATWNEL